MDELNGLFYGKKMPNEKSGYKLYQKAQAFNTSINLNDTVRVNENFYIGE